jgi:hypothetical protein
MPLQNKGSLLISSCTPASADLNLQSCFSSFLQQETAKGFSS